MDIEKNWYFTLVEQKIATAFIWHSYVLVVSISTTLEKSSVQQLDISHLQDLCKTEGASMWQLVKG